MRENRPSGSEGGVAFGPSLPLSGQRPTTVRSAKPGSRSRPSRRRPNHPGQGEPSPGARVSSPAACEITRGGRVIHRPAPFRRATGEDTRAPGQRPTTVRSAQPGTRSRPSRRRPNHPGQGEPSPGARVSSPAACEIIHGGRVIHRPAPFRRAAGEDTRARALGKAHTPKGASPFLAVLPARQRKETASWRSGRGEQLEVNG